jgi:hypothetical protein
MSLAPEAQNLGGNSVFSTKYRKADRGRASRHHHHHYQITESPFLDCEAISSESPCIISAFVVNLEPYTGESPSVRVYVELITMLK